MKRNIILYGAGKVGHFVSQMIDYDSICCFVDKDVTGEIFGIPVIHPEKLTEYLDGDNIDIIITTINNCFVEEIKKQLEMTFGLVDKRVELYELKDFFSYNSIILFGAESVPLKNALVFFSQEKEKVLCTCSTVDIPLSEGVPIRKILVRDIDIEIFKKIIKKFNLKIVVTTASKPYLVDLIRWLMRNQIQFELFEDRVKKKILEEAQVYEQLCKRDLFRYDPKYSRVCIGDRFETAGKITNYFYQDLWAAKRIYESRVDLHYDIGSRVDGFIAHLLSYGQKVKMIDIRPLKNIVGLDFVQADATNLDGIQDDTIESLSALCSLEHFGLGRYGDPIDPEACFTCFEAIQRKMKTGGKLYLSLPIGQERLWFNGERVFNPQTIVDCFEKMDLLEFSSCFENQFEENVDIHKYDQEELPHFRFGLFLMRKK